MGSRLRHLRFAVLVWLSPVAKSAQRARRGVLGAMVVVAIVCGVWGWFLYADENPDAGYGVWEVALATIGMFTVAGDVEPIPWQLDVGRILGGLATVGIVTEVVIESLAKVLVRRASKRATDHLLVLGRADQAIPYLTVDAAQDPRRPAILLTDEPDVDPENIPGRVLVPTGGTDRWAVRGNAPEAARIVVATGDDDTNLAALVDALQAPARPDARITVEIDDPVRALEVSIGLAADLPGFGGADRDVEVSCPHQARGSYAVDRFLAEVADEIVTGGRPCVAIGDNPRSRSAAMYLKLRLAELALATAEGTPRLHLVDPEIELLEATVTPQDRARLQLTLGSTADPTSWPEAVRSSDNPPILLLDFDDEALVSPRRMALLNRLPNAATTAARPTFAARALDSVNRLPAAEAWVPRNDLPDTDDGGPDLRPGAADGGRFGVLRVGDAEGAGYGRGPFLGAALHRHIRPALARTPAHAGPSAAVREQLRLQRDACRTDDRALRAAAAEVRAAVAVVAGSAYEVLPAITLDEAWAHPRQFIEDPQVLRRAALAMAPGHTREPRDPAEWQKLVEAHDPSDLITALGRQGLVIRPPQEEPTVEIYQPDADTVSRMAELIHDHYRATTELEDGHEAKTDWDALPVHLKAQNRDQARDNVVKLARRGILVIPVDQVRPDDVPIEAAEIEQMAEEDASDEHDRWAQQKRAQGYRLGAPRNDDPEAGPLLHPDLKPWRDLDEAAQDKDKAPIRNIPKVLTGVGLAMVRRP